MVMPSMTPPPDSLGAPPDMGMGMPLPDTGPSPEEMYDLMRKAQEELERQWEADHAPVYPPWYDEKDYPKPDPGKMLEKAQQLDTEFMGLRRRIANDQAIVRMEVAGVFKSDIDDAEDKWFDAGIAGEVELAVAHYADIEPTFDAPARFRSEEDEAARKIDFAIACYDDAGRQHHRLGGGPLRVEKARTLAVSGRLCWQVMLNPDADEDEMPFQERLVDPSTCYPVFESGRGLRLMVRSYATTLGDAVAAFDTSEEDLYNQYFSERSKKTGQFQRKRQEQEHCSVVEYWDRRWRAIFIDQTLVLGPLEHKFGFVPFVYQMSGMGMPSYLRDPSTASMRDVHGFEFSDTISTRDVSAPHKGIGLVSLLRVPHQIREAMLTRMLTAFGRSMEPPVGVEMDEMTYSKGTPDISWQRNAKNPLRMGRQKLVEMNSDPSLPMLQGLMGAAEDSRSRTMMPQMAHGANDKSNVAGYATNVLNEMGMTKLVVNKQSLEDFERSCMEMRFALYRDWGHVLKQGRNGRFGELMVPRRDALPHEDQTTVLTPGDLRRTGIRVNVSFAHISMQMMGPVANALMIMKQAGWVDDVRALRMLGSPNPYKELRRIQMNAILNDPAILEAEVIAGLVREGMVGEAAYFMQRKNAKAMGPAGMMPGMGMDGGGMPSPGGSPVGTVVGDSNAQYGFGPGPGSGPSPALPPTSPFGTEP